jgi:flavin-dependent thymidylate synthase
VAEVKLIDYTGFGSVWRAADILIFTKNTRLNLNAEDVKDLSFEEKLKELNYMTTTIPSSWEFVDLTFVIEGVTRACAQQITRTRTGSYAMQSQRVTDVSEAEVVNPFIEDELLQREFELSAEMTMNNYKDLLESGASPQDARGILPMNITCNLVAKYNLRSFTDLVKARRSKRTQGEYADIIERMYNCVIDVWPWAKPFFISSNQKALEILEEILEEVGLDIGSGTGWKIAKAMDLIRGAK